MRSLTIILALAALNHVHAEPSWPRQREAIRARWQTVLGEFPTAKAPLKAEVLSTDTLADHTRQHVRYQVEDGIFTDAWLLTPKQAAGKSPAIVVFHQTVKTHAQQAAGIDDSKPELMQGLQLVRRGYIVLCPRCYIFDEGASIADNAKLVLAHRPAWTGMARMTWDGIRAADYLQSLPNVNAGRLGCIGHSLGAKEVLYAAAFDERYKVAVFSEGGIGLTFSNWEAPWYLGPRIRDPGFKQDHDQLIQLIAPRPFLLLAGDSADGDKSAAFIDAARPVYEQLGAGDNLRMLNHRQGHRYPLEARAAAEALFDKHLKAGAETAYTLEAPRVRFTRMIAHWSDYGDPDYVRFVEEARPEVAQVGFYGGHFWSLSHTPQYKGYPAHFPVQGLKECGDWFTGLNVKLHALNTKVVGHFNIKFLVGDPDGPDGPRGFFKFYRDLWDERELGPKPVADPIQLLERDASGTPIVNEKYKIGGMKEYWGCLLNPHWRAVLKAWAKRGIERGVDGYMINYFYRHNCLCEHCRAGFRDYMSERFTVAQLRDLFGISDIKTRVFAEIVAWHPVAESTPLRREMLRFSQIANKRAYDEVFVDYARKLKPGLILGQWNHLGDFNQVSGDERCLLPAEMWGRGEDYAWYSTGASAYYTDLANGWLGEGTLQARYLAGALGGKPFTLGKYESTRTRVAIAELAANGGVPMGFYTRFKSPEARAEINRYYHFIEQHDAVYRGARAHAESVLLYPRTSIHDGKMEALATFKTRGHELLDEHRLFAILPDDIAVPEHLKVNPAAPRSRFDAPKTVRVSASVPASGDRLHFHFVNYNRTEPEKPKSAGRGIEDEKPVATNAISCDIVLPANFMQPSLTVWIPESPVPQPLESKLDSGRLRFILPPFLVYAVVEVSQK